MSAALAYETRVRQELPRILREVREPAKVIAFKTGCTPRTVEAIRQNEHGVSIGTLFAMANQVSGGCRACARAPGRCHAGSLAHPFGNSKDGEQMTEEEAKTKWCAFVHRDNKIIDHARTGATCIGSACMAWRWGGLAHGATTLTAQMVYDPETKSMETISEDPPKWGFCGLAGRP